MIFKAWNAGGRWGMNFGLGLCCVMPYNIVVVSNLIVQNLTLICIVVFIKLELF